MQAARLTARPPAVPARRATSRGRCSAVPERPATTGRPAAPPAPPSPTSARRTAPPTTTTTTPPPPRPPPPPPAQQAGAPARLFSNLGPDLKHAPGSTAGAAALIAGTTVGAGVLALPAVTAPAGFLPSAVGLVAAWAFSVASGLLVAEVNLNTLCELGRGSSSMKAMSERTLGPAGATAASGAYAFLHGALLVAYISRAADVVSGAAGLPQPAAAAAFTAGIGALCAGFSPAALDAANGAAVAAVVGTFLALCGAVAASHPPSADALLAHADWAALLPAAPVLALAFVYQNVVPVVVSQLEGDAAKIRAAILGGTAIPFFMFLGWEAVCLGAGGPAGGGGAAAGGAVVDPLALLRSPATAPLLDAFSLLAVGTSAIGFTLALTDFAGEATGAPARSALPYALTLLPPLAGAVLAPGIFFSALNAAGTYGVLSLFGLLPAAMAAVERRGAALGLPPQSIVRLLGGGPAGLIGVGGAAAAVIAEETWRAVSGGG